MISCKRNSYDLIFFTLSFIGISFCLLNSFSIDKHLSADGVNYFIGVLEHKKFMHIDWSRYHAQYINQFPLLLAVKGGITNIMVLSWFYAFGIYLPYVLSFVLCLFALRGLDKQIMFFYIASIIAVNLSSDYILAGEHQIMALFTWPILFLLLRKRWSLFDIITLSILFVIYSRLYQSAFFPSIVYIIILIFRYKAKEKKGKTMIITFILMNLVIIIMNLWTIFSPISPENRGSFLMSLANFIINPDSLLPLFVLCLFLIYRLFDRKWLLVISIAIPIGYLIYRIAFPEGVGAGLSFGSRTNTITVLPILILLSLVFWKMKPFHRNLNKLTISVYLVSMLSANIIQSDNWRTYKEEVKEVLIENLGFISMESTNLLNNQYKWSWNNSQISLVWSYPCVKSIILNEKRIASFPFDPRKTIILKDYLKYDSIFKVIDPGIQVCENAGFNQKFGNMVD